MMNSNMLLDSDRTDLSTESGSGPIQLARTRYRTARRSVAAAALYECATAHMQAKKRSP